MRLNPRGLATPDALNVLTSSGPSGLAETEIRPPPGSGSDPTRASVATDAQSDTERANETSTWPLPAATAPVAVPAIRLGMLLITAHSVCAGFPGGPCRPIGPCGPVSP